MKCDITLNKEQTINIGNYSNIKPSVSVTLKDVDIKSFDYMYDNLSDLVSCLLSYETKTSLEEVNMVSKVTDRSCIEYVNNMNENVDFDFQIKKLTKELKDE